MLELQQFVAVDLGASSGRIILGKISSKKIEYEEVHRFSNGPVEANGELYWDIESLRSNVMQGLSKLDGSRIASIGVDSWAVDFGYVGHNGQLLRSPHHYRDERNLRGVRYVDKQVSQPQLYAQVGLQFLPFNTLYQLAVDHVEESELLGLSDKALLIPDLFNFWLCGAFFTERTNASTTGLLDPITKTWSNGLVENLGLQRSLLAEVVSEGTYIGNITVEVGELTGLSSSTKVVTVGSHDTASAYVAVPSTKPNSLFISSGTWSLLGVELDEPILTEAARLANFTNEGGVDGRVRFLKNVTGLWLLQESVREWRTKGKTHQIEVLIEAAKALPPRSLIDVDDQRFVAPGDMALRIQDACTESGQWMPETEAEIVRVIFDSMVSKYLAVMAELEGLTGRKIERIHIVGGGSQNELLNQLLADHSGLQVLAGPVEATAIGNLLVQARAAGVIHGTLEDLRELVSQNFPIKTFSPNSKEKNHGSN